MVLNAKQLIEDFGFGDDITIIRFLGDGQYRYEYTYHVGRDEEEPYRSCYYSYDFTEKELLDEEAHDEAIDVAKQYLEDHETLEDAVNELINFSDLQKEKVKIVPSLTLEEAVRLGNEEGYDVVIF